MNAKAASVFLCISAVAVAVVASADAGVASAPVPSVPSSSSSSPLDVTMYSSSCEGAALTMGCPMGTTIKITKGFYGRNDGVTCPSPSIRTTRCSAPRAMAVMQQLCDGKQDCSVPVSNDAFDGDPCYLTFKYAIAEFVCVAPPQTQLACEGADLSLSCGDGAVVRVKKAFYGRRDRTTCPNPSILTTSCAAPDATAVVGKYCNGKQSCAVSATNQIFGGDPCLNTFKYSTVDYECVPENAVALACEGSNAVMQCPRGSVIDLKEGVYGRFTEYFCPPLSGALPSAAPCAAENSTAILRSHCDGKPSCSVPATNAEYYDPCYLTPKYAVAMYACKPQH